MIQPIDFAHLATYTGGDRALEDEVFALFREQAEMWLRLLTVDAAVEDWMSAAHSLKGSARGVGAFGLAACCEAAERAAEGSRAARAVAAQDVRDAVKHVLDAVANRDYANEIGGLRAPRS
jgi:chemotaxis protein histidine kinase CheA